MQFATDPDKAAFKSIPAGFDTGALPDLTILTGPNGSGKSQLLHLIGEHFNLDGGKFQNTYPGVGLATDLTCDNDDCVLVPWNATLGGAGNISPTFLTNIARTIKQQGQNAETLRIKTIMGSDFDDLHQKSIGEIVKLLPIEATLPKLEYASSASQLARLAMQHLTSIANLAKNEILWSEATERVNKNHPNPTDEVNTLLSSAGVGFQILPPESFDVDYELLARVDQADISTSELSSGEQTILSIILLSLFASRDRPPKLLILDETDAHLHPSQIPGFLKLLIKLTDSGKTKIILATHRISTVSLAPESALYLKKSHTLTKSSRAQAAGAIAGFVVDAFKSARLVYVEDRADVEFYATVDRIRTKTANHPELVFQPVVTGGGGCQEVVKRVNAIRATNLGGFVRGLIDRDVANPSKPDIFVLPRYAIENFLFDPLVLYMEFIKNGAPISIPDSASSSGADHQPLANTDLGKLSTLPPAHLQDIASALTGAIEPKLQAIHKNKTKQGNNRPPFDTTPEQMTYNNGSVTLTVPNWLLTARGKDFYQAAQDAFRRRPKKDDLAYLFETIDLLPDDLVSFMDTIQ